MQKLRALLLLLLLAFCAVPIGAAEERTRVLVLHSYHRGYQWTDDIAAALDASLAAQAPQAELSHEYLDTKRYPRGEHLELFARVLAAKYQGREFAAVVVSDNNAFTFIKERRQELFPGVPVVFCGVNFLRPADLEGLEGFTGVSEEVDFHATAELALGLHPDTRRLVVVNDATTTGQRLRPRLEQLAEIYRDRVAVELLTDVSVEELKEALRRLDPGTVVLYTLFFRDRLGQFLEYDTSTRMVTEAAPVPVYGTWDFSLGHGIVGGMLTSGRGQGEAAAGLVTRILAGTPPDALPVITKSPNRYLFDWRQLRLFGIPEGRLPPGSTVLFRPETLYQRYPNLVQGVVAAGVVLLVVLLFQAQDIARRKRAQREIASSERNYRELFAATSDAVFVHDARNGVILGVNRAMLEMYGCRREDVEGASVGVFSDGSPPYGVADAVEWLRRAVEQGPQVFPWRARRSDGTRFWVEVALRSSAIGGEDRVLASVRDISDRKAAAEALEERGAQLAATVARLEEEAGERARAEEELRAQTRATEAAERRYRSLFEEAPTMYVITRRDGGDPVIEDCNGEFLQALGYPRAQVVGERLSRFYSFESARALREGGYRKALEGGVADVERVLVRADGTELRTLLRANPEMDAEGQVIGTRALFVDITQRVAAEQELRSLEEQLIQAQKMEAVGTLASGIAHDFNNLLQGISGFSQLLGADPELSTENRRRVGQIERSAERAADLVRDLLAFGRKARSELAPTDLNAVVVGVAELLERTIPKMIRLELRLAPDLPAVQADATQLHQVLLNLANNGRDAMPEGGQLTITSEVVDLDAAAGARHGGLAPGEHVRLRVADTGVGIPGDVQPNIFDPFFTTKGVGEGTGLGLSMVYGIVKNHGGTVTCHSEPGRGTTFELLLPVTREAPAPATDGVLRSTTGSETVLLVDDEAMVLDVARTALTANGYRVLTAASGEEALSVYQGAGVDVDLVVLDVGMPGMGGMRCLEALRRHDPEARVVLSTGYGAGVTGSGSDGAAADAVLPKPYSLHRLLDAVREVLDR